MSKNRRTYTNEEFIKAVETSYSIAQVLVKLGLNPQGGNYRVFRKFQEELNLDISHFTGKGHNKGKKSNKRRNIDDYLSNKVSIQSHKLKIRLLEEKIFDSKCSCCKLGTWNELPIPLELDHINGNHLDNSLTNLRLLCPNCHAQTPTYRGKNKKSKPKTETEKKIRKPKIERKIKSTNKTIKNSYDRPKKFNVEKEELHKLVWSMSTTKVAELFNVSGKAIEKRCKLLGVSKPPRGYWAKFENNVWGLYCPLI